MVFTATYQGEKKCVIKDENGYTAHSAVPKEFGGDGSTFGPTDFVAVGLSSCMLSVMAIYAERHGFSIDGSVAEVEKQTKAGNITKLPAKISLPSNVPEDKREGLEQTAHHCPVHRSLHPDIEAPIFFEYSL